MSFPVGSRNPSPTERKNETPELVDPRRKPIRDLNPLFTECLGEDNGPQNLQLNGPAFCFTPETVNGRIDADLERAILTEDREKAFSLIATRKNSLKNPNNAFVQVVQKGWDTEALLLAAETHDFSAHYIVFICIEKKYKDVVKVLLERNLHLFKKKDWFLEKMDEMKEKNHEIYDLFALYQIEDHYNNQLEEMLNEMSEFDLPDKETTWMSSVVEKPSLMSRAIQYFDAVSDCEAAIHVLEMEKPIQNLEQLIRLASELKWEQTQTALRIGIE